MKLTIRGMLQLAGRRRADLVRLGPELRAPLTALLDHDPVANVFLRSEMRLGARLEAWWGLGDGEGLRAALMGGPVVVPWIPDLDDASAIGAALAHQLPPRLIIGPAPAVRALAGLLGPHRRPVEVRDPQPVMVLDGPPSSLPGVPIRRGRRDDLDALTVAAAAMHREEMGVDPMAVDAVGWRLRMAALIDRGWSFLLMEGDQIAFKLELSAWTPEAVQIQGVWTDPRFRRRGIATAAMAAVCAELLTQVPVCSLYVNAYNEPALRLYRRLGFRQVGDFATFIY
ncbi:MAG: GNAT family N-acetyltransferase [Candidatus Dormibacteria bacterium]|jgi:GNAT superfamily N-acetyltransferase